MGQFRPTLRARRSFPADLALFSAGFLVSSVASFALLAVGAGVPLSSALAPRIRLTILLGLVLVFMALDVRQSRGGLRCSFGPHRQTPRRLGYQPIGPLLWGLDTGLPLTTYRATALPFIGVALVALGFGHPWIGLAYATGFLGSLLASCAWPRRGGASRSEPREHIQQDPLQVVRALQTHTRSAWTASLVLSSTLALLLVARVFSLL